MHDCQGVARRRCGDSGLRNDGGFTLVELMVAVLIGVIVSVAFTTTLRSALSGSRSNRFRQEATSVAMEQFEHARSLQWEELAMAQIDPSAPLIDGYDETLLASLTGLTQDEPLLQCSGGGVDPVTVRIVDDVTYTTWTYVTKMSDSLRRVVVLVTWNVEGQTFSHRSDSVVSVVSAGGLSAYNQPMFPEGAVIATGNVALNGGRTQTAPSTAHAASVWLNASFSDLNAQVDGSIHAGGVVNATPSNVYGVIEQNAGTPVNTPSVTDIEVWRTGMRAAAQAGSGYPGNTVLADTVVAAPIHVEGTLEFQGNVQIVGSGPVYATGVIRLQANASVGTEAAYLVSDAAVVIEPGAAYTAAERTSAGVIAFGQSEQALQLRGGPVGTVQGLAYAPYGGAVFTAGAPWHGAIVTGGNDSSGSVTFIGAATVDYPATLMRTTVLVEDLRPEPIASACG